MTRDEAKEMLAKLAYVFCETGRANREFVDIITCLRSCDELADGRANLKSLTVSRLRAVIGVQRSVLLHIREKPLIYEEMVYRDRLLARAPLHFVDHWCRAVEAVMFLYNYDLSKEKPI